MKNYNKKKSWTIKRHKISLLLFILGILFLKSCSSTNLQGIDEKNTDNFEQKSDKIFNIRNAGYWNLNPIIIDNNWSETESAYEWCVIKNGKYRIENITIDGGGLSSCLSILNTNESFLIRNCTLFNSGSSSYDAGIYLNNVNNGTIFDNNCFNNRNGISLSSSKNNTIINNTILDSGSFGIRVLHGDNNDNKIIKNICSFNNLDGIWLSASTGTFANNLISENKVFNNSRRGIWVDAVHSENEFTDNTISKNLISNNSQSGIYAYIFDGAVISNNIFQENSISNNPEGIYISNDAIGGGVISNNIFQENIISNNLEGIYIDDATGGVISNNIFQENTISNNPEGIYIDDATENYFFENNFLENDLQVSTNSLNYWNNSIIGNYWDDYSDLGVGAEDSDDDGIGDIPYDIDGTYYDYLPIYNDGFNGDLIVINDIDYVNTDWKWAQGKYWCSGSGSFDDPFIIEDLIVDGNDIDSCITIENSNAYFVIKNCTLYNSSQELDNAGIKLNNVINGKIVDCNISFNKNGITLVDSTSIEVSYNNLQNNTHNGLYLQDSHSSTVINNDIINNTLAIKLRRSNDNNISINTFTHNLLSIYDEGGDGNFGSDFDLPSVIRVSDTWDNSIENLVSELNGNTMILKIILALEMQIEELLSRLYSIVKDNISLINTIVEQFEIKISDTDFDNLNDLDEISNGTNPVNIDTDNDNFLDGYEVDYGSDPNDPLNYPAMPQAWYDEIYEDLEGNATLIENLIEWVDGNSTLLENVMVQLDQNATLLQQVIGWLDGNHSAIENLFTYVNGNATLLLNVIMQLDSNATQIDLVLALANQNAVKLNNLNATHIANVTDIWNVLNQIGATIGDLDYDGLNDLDEVIYGTKVDCADTDCDNLNDAFEIKYGTDPLDDDSDGDGHYDGIELASGTNPLDPEDYPGRIDNSQDKDSEEGDADEGTFAPELLLFGGIMVLAVVGAAVAVAMAKKNGARTEES